MLLSTASFPANKACVPSGLHLLPANNVVTLPGGSTILHNHTSMKFAQHTVNRGGGSREAASIELTMRARWNYLVKCKLSLSADNFISVLSFITPRANLCDKVEGKGWAEWAETGSSFEKNKTKREKLANVARHCTALDSLP